MKTFPRMKKRLLLLAALAALTWGAYAQEVKIGMVNDGTRRFLEEVDYSADTAYVVSYARDYRKNLGASDRPKPVTVTWTEGNAAKVLVSRSPLFEAATEVPFEAAEAKIYNLVPGVKYFYKVLDGDGKVLASAGFTPVGPLRMIAGVASNMRDLGGWKADGGHIAYGKLFRGAALSTRRTTERAKEIFKDDLGISVDLDLRGIKESEANVGPVVEGVEYIKFPVEKNLGRGTGNTEELYQQAIRAIIGYLGEGRAVYFHCAGGADRTGTLGFLIEALLGVSESDMSKDYEITTFAGPNTRLRNFRDDGKETHILYEAVRHLRKFGWPEVTDIHQLVYNWATTRHSASVDPLTPAEIALLRSYLIEKETVGVLAEPTPATTNQPGKAFPKVNPDLTAATELPPKDSKALSVASATIRTAFSSTNPFTKPPRSSRMPGRENRTVWVAGSSSTSLSGTRDPAETSKNPSVAFRNVSHNCKMKNNSSSTSTACDAAFRFTSDSALPGRNRLYRRSASRTRFQTESTRSRADASTRKGRRISHRVCIAPSRE